MEIFATNFLDTYSIGEHIVQYSNFIEIAQGGPEVGKLAIDGKPVGHEDDYFGGPPVFYQNHMFAPRLKKSLFGRHFKLGVINLNDLSVAEAGGKEELILLSKADESTVYFFVDNPNNTLKSVRWKNK